MMEETYGLAFSDSELAVIQTMPNNQPQMNQTNRCKLHRLGLAKLC